MLLCNRVTSTQDRQKLSAAIERARSSWLTYAPCLDHFSAELRRRETVQPGQVPDYAITMNSRFALLLHPEEEVICYLLVYPEEASPAHGKISVLSPLGMALFGARVGERVTWVDEHGKVRYATVQRLLFQPESAEQER